MADATFLAPSVLERIVLTKSHTLLYDAFRSILHNALPITVTYI